MVTDPKTVVGTVFGFVGCLECHPRNPRAEEESAVGEAASRVWQVDLVRQGVPQKS